MNSELWDGLVRVYNSGVPAGEVSFTHHWRAVSVDKPWPSVLRVVRAVDAATLEEGGLSPLKNFLAYNGGVAMAYPLAVACVPVGLAFRAVSNKEMKSFVKVPGTACFTASRFYACAGSLDYSKPLVLSEGFADAEAIGNFYPFSMATMGGPLKFALVPLVRRLFRKVVLMMDNDDPGRRADKLIRKRLSSCGLEVKSLTYPQEYKDPAEFYLADPDEMRSRVETALGRTEC